MSTRRHVVLIGIMGSGKTAIGEHLAERLGRPFVDTDAVIESQAGVSIRHLFAEQGEEAFREIERRVVGEVLRRDDPAVVATGGGAVLDPVSRSLMVDRGAVVWLDPPIERIAARLDDDDSRPLLDGRTAAEGLTRIRADRAARYEEVAHTRVAIDADVVVVADAVAAAIETLEAA